MTWATSDALGFWAIVTSGLVLLLVVVGLVGRWPGSRLAHRAAVTASAAWLAAVGLLVTHDYAQAIGLAGGAWR